jgi:integrase
MSATAEPLGTFEAAVGAFLAQSDLARSSWIAYRRVLQRLANEFQALDGSDRGAWPGDSELEDAVARLWGGLSPASWNRNTAIVRSFIGWAAERRYLDRTPRLVFRRRRERADRARAIPYAQLEALFTRETVALREKALWRLLYETAARTGEILALDVDDLDLATKRARIRAKGGDLEVVHFQSGSARLLPRLLAGRRHGPVFLTDRTATPGTAAVDVCPVTGRARLSYRRAAALFTEHSGGWTLHQLRHSAITHLAEQGVGTTLLMAKSRHRSLRTLERYARPGEEAVAALTARHDPGRRRR